MPPTVGNPERIYWNGSRTREGHREYKLGMLVLMDSPLDGPASVLAAPGLPTIGSSWIYGNDNDPYALCLPTASCKMVIEDEPNWWWISEYTFSTLPMKRCQDNSIENPLNEPPGLSGSFVRYTKQLEQDRNGKAIKSSSHEPITGLERDASRPTVVVTQNVLDLEYGLLAQMVDTVSDAPMWGLPNARTVKLGPPQWDRRVYGTCTFYFTRRLEFEIKYEGWDYNDVVDKGYKKFRGAPLADNPTTRGNPENYIIAKDAYGENTPKPVLLDGNGSMLTDPDNPVYLDPIEVYAESNFFLLGVPSSFT